MNLDLFKYQKAEYHSLFSASFNDKFKSSISLCSFVMVFCNRSFSNFNSYSKPELNCWSSFKTKKRANGRGLSLMSCLLSINKY